MHFQVHRSSWLGRSLRRACFSCSGSASLSLLLDAAGYAARNRSLPCCRHSWSPLHVASLMISACIMPAACCRRTQKQWCLPDAWQGCVPIPVMGCPRRRKSVQTPRLCGSRGPVWLVNLCLCAGSAEVTLFLAGCSDSAQIVLTSGVWLGLLLAVAGCSSSDSNNDNHSSASVP